MISEILCLLTTGFLPQTTRNLGSGSKSVWWSPIPSSPPRQDYVIYQGDILLPTNENLRNAIKVKKHLWKNGIVPYEFRDNFTTNEENLIRKAMSTFEEKSCVRFVPRDEHETFIRFQKEKSGCYAPIGRLPGNSGSLPVNLQAPECFAERGIIEHELLHVLGLFHEQARPDRDNYVKIHWCNIVPEREADFVKASDFEVDDFGMPYDYSSIMHYPKWAFSKNGESTITSKLNPLMELGQRKSPTETDFKKVLKMYDCKA